MIRVIGPKDTVPANAFVVNTTSRSNNWSRGLSPFFLGPVNLYQGYTAKNVENAWQFAKVYPGMVDSEGNPSSTYFAWAQAGWNDTKAHRYPMGRHASTPLYSWWDGKRFSYIEARKQIYVPIYVNAVVSTQSYRDLEFHASLGDVWLWDFDGYDHRSLGMSYDDVMNCQNRKMGHAFVLAMLLDGYIA